MIDFIFAHLQNPASQIVIVVIFATGIVRGFSGFGSGMIIGPITAALFTPKFAVAVITIVDSFPTLKLVWSARKQVVWRQIIPIAIGYAALAPLGVWALKTSDPIALRWFICMSIFIAIALLWGGWKYRGPRNPPVSLVVGATGGFMGAIASLPGPAALLYWLSSDDKAATVRANMIYYLFLGDVIVIGAYFIGDIFTQKAVSLGLLSTPGYFIGLLIGTHFFKGASEATYRTIAFSMILLAAVSSLPLLDGLLR